MTDTPDKIAREALTRDDAKFTDARIKQIAAAIRNYGDTRSHAAAEEMRREKDNAYLERNQLVAALTKLYPAGIAKTAIPGRSEDWHGCVYIDLPSGQVSWHFHDSQATLFAHLTSYTGTWDGHDTPEKYRRLATLPIPDAPEVKS